jgi:16S rRNA processing protein RimM
LIGLKVVNAEKIELGRVVRIVQTGANDVLVVAEDGGGQHGDTEEILIPFIADAIKKVDVAAGVIAVDWGRDY